MSKGTILVIDDEPQIQKMLGVILAHAGYDIVNADSGAPEGIVVQAMLQAKQAGVDNFLIAVKRE